MACLKTEDKITVRTGALIWYVNYLGQVKCTKFNKKGKRTVKYFSLLKNAQDYVNKSK